MQVTTYRRTDELDRRHKRAVRRALLASVIFHVLVVLLFRTDRIPPSPFAAAGPRADDASAAAGGGELQAISIRLPPPQPEEIPVPPEPIPVPDATLELDAPDSEIQPPSFAAVEGAAAGKQGDEVGPGLTSGTGEGDGGTEMEGRFRVVPPSPRGLILPPSDRPRGVRGKEVTVYVFVTEGGRVIPDSTQVRPSTGDRRFDDRLRRQAAEWVFEPGRKGGQVVAEWFQYVITL